MTAKVPSFATAVAIGILSAALFSLTFVINASIAQNGGPWQWTAALRYFFTIPILFAVLAYLYGWKFIHTALTQFVQRLFFWVFAGTLACGLFYAGIAYSADHLAGWAVAATWQLTVVASVIIVFLFSRSFSAVRLAVAGLVVVGVFLVNWPSDTQSGFGNWLALAMILISAIAYPIGNQLLNREIYRTKSAGNNAPSPFPLNNPLVGILLLSLGSLPFWIGLLIISPPGPVQPGQVFSILLTTVFAGIFATGLFFYARNLTSDPSKITAIDVTQSSEVIFAMMFEIAFIHPAIPTPIQGLGVVLIIVGVIGNCMNFKRSPK